MNILMTGGTGFIGTKFCADFEGRHAIVVKTRLPEGVQSSIKSVKTLSEIDADTRFDAVINLAGEPIADKRWSTAQKQSILQSRLQTTEELIAYFRRATHKPVVFISGSAIGYYGIEPTNQPIDELAHGDDSFSSALCTQWEASAKQAEDLGIRTCLLRTGIVLGKNGGALSKMLMPFKLGLGGKIGSGEQWMPWIHIDDIVGIIEHCMVNNDVFGPINGTAPHPVTNTEFTKTLGKVLKRPTVLPMPAFVIKLLMGQMGEELLLAGKKVVPARALSSGYQFKYETLEAALRNVVE